MSEKFTLGVNYWPRRKAMYWWSNFDAGEVREEGVERVDGDGRDGRDFAQDGDGADREIPECGEVVRAHFGARQYGAERRRRRHARGQGEEDRALVGRNLHVREDSGRRAGTAAKPGGRPP